MADRKEKYAKKNFKIFSEWGVLSSKINQRTGEKTEVRLTKTSWFGKLPKWDIRNWIGGDRIAGQGVVIGSDAALKRLRDLLIDCMQTDRSGIRGRR